MKNRSKRILFALLLTCSVAMLASGCDKLKKEPETEQQTEPPTEKQTEPPTEKQTEPPTEPQTEPPTEPQTESETEPKVLTIDEEKAQETEFDQLKTMYAMDDINVRTQPGTDDSSEIFESFMQGDVVTIVGETPNWYMVDVEGYDVHGYVSKQFMSETEVAPKTEEERLRIIEQQANEAGSGSGDSAAPAGTTAAGSANSDIDAEYGVGAYAEAFTIQASTGANLRTTPAQDGEIIATIASGTNVTALGETDRWYKVDYNGTVGYVNKNLFAAQ